MDSIDDNDNISMQDNEDDDKLKTFLNELPETDGILEYFQILDNEIPTEEYLTEEQIVNMV